MSVVLSEHLPVLATAPDGIKKLRGLILELAVRGKLVPQDPIDEPACVLLMKIAEERNRLEAEGMCKKAKPVPPVHECEQPFALPSNWGWCRLPDAADYRMGKTPPTKESTYWTDNGIPWVSISDMVHGESVNVTSRTISGIARDKVFKSDPAPAGTLLMSFKLTVGKIATLGIDAFHNEAIISIYPFSGVSQAFLSHFLPTIAQAGNSKSALMGNTLNSESLALLAIPLPPFAEQQRIVAKVDELMALCDRLGAEQADADTAHSRLIETLLGALTQSADADEFYANWQLLAGHFDTLFTTEASIDALKRTILQLAVMGKLVPQETNCFDRAALSDGIVLPTGWRLEQIEEFCNVQGGIQKTPLRRPLKNHFPYLRVANVQRGKINIDELARYELTQEELARWSLNAGDLLIVEGNGSESEIGRCAIWNGQVADCVYQNHLIRVRPHVSEQVDYLQLFLNSPVGVCHMKRLAITTSGLFNLSVGKIRGIEVPLPPLAEQRRIVAKVDELMALCDRLKADLVDSRSRQARLVDTLIAAALEAA